jgi:predicted Zn-dependent peptidase
LKHKALDVLTQFVQEGVTVEEFQVEFHKQERSLEKSLQTNDFCLAALGASIAKGRDLMEIPDQLEGLREITLEQMNLWISKLFNLEHYCHTMSLPKLD